MFVVDCSDGVSAMQRLQREAVIRVELTEMRFIAQIGIAAPVRVNNKQLIIDPDSKQDTFLRMPDLADLCLFRA